MASSRSTALAVLRLLTVAGLGVEAYVHIHLAPRYDGILGAAGISQGMLFRSVGAIAILRPDAGGETERGVVHLRQRFLVRCHFHHGDDGTEGFPLK